MKPQGTSIIFINADRQILLLLRDDIPTIPYPNMWDLPGGHVEPGETPEQCIVREMKEEIGLDLDGHQLFSVVEFNERIEYTYWKSANLDIDQIVLTEGQTIKWFSKNEVAEIELACNFNEVVAEFHRDKPFESSQASR